MIDEIIVNLSKKTIEQIDEAYENKILNVKEKFQTIINLFFNFLKNASSIDSSHHYSGSEFVLHFNSNFARIQYLISKYNLPVDYANLVPNINRLKMIYQEEVEEQIVEKVKISIDDFLNVFSNQEINSNTINLLAEISSKNSQIYYKFKSFEYYKNNNFRYLLTCYNENLQLIQILLSEKYYYLKGIPNIDTTLLISNIELLDFEKQLYKQTQRTRIIVEPGYLFDITDIAECFSNNALNPMIYFKKILTNFSISHHLAKGYLVNSIFDSLINDPAIDFETAFKQAIKQRPISLIASLLSESDWDMNNGYKLKETAIELKKVVYENYRNLQQIIPSLELGNYIIEPSFISEAFGLQGRLDLLINKDLGQKNVIELKSGKFPSTNINVGYLQSDSYINVWINHYAQANGYNLLLDDVFENRRGTSAILYSTDLNKPLRNVSNFQNIKDLILHTRNQLMVLIKQIVTNDIDLEWIVQKTQKLFLGYSNKEKSNEIFDNLEIGEWQYLNDCFRFIIIEEYLTKLRNNILRLDVVHNDYRLSIQNDSFSISSSWEIDYDESDFVVNHLVLKNINNIVNYREADQVILYPDEYLSQPTKFYILKGTVRLASNNSVKVSLLSKTTDKNLFLNYSKWTIEIDNSDDLTKKQLQILTKFIYSPKENRKKVIYGNQNHFEHKKIQKFRYLNNKQQKLVQRAINNQDYFLIQGPPGTGKTSRILRALVDYYYSNTENKIVLMAFTNRSVDEICHTLDKIEPNFPFLRVSSKNIENYVERSVPFISEKSSINDLLQKFNKTRVFVGTVSAFTSNLEIFHFIKFDLLILDEASQVLETQINGFLSSVSKFILIGDINQLPAITVQENFMETNGNSHSILGQLLEKAKQNNRFPPIGHLRHQGRMHKKIQDLANFLTYQENLYPITKSQISNEEPLYLANFNHPWLSNRVVFVEAPSDTDIKSNKYESDMICKFLIDYFRYSGSEIPSHRIGVVTPFKKQCALIKNSLPQEISEKITIDTVERFQGSERDIIIYSFSLNHKIMLDRIRNTIEINGKLVDRKFNVATTRAKEHLIILGNSSILSSDKYYKQVLVWIDQNGTIIKRRGRPPINKK